VTQTKRQKCNKGGGKKKSSWELLTRRVPIQATTPPPSPNHTHNNNNNTPTQHKTEREGSMSTQEEARAAADLEKQRADALITACNLGLKDDLIDLVGKGATFECSDKKGVRPMFFAAAQGHSEVVELLCARGVDPNDDDQLGRTPLHFAAMAGLHKVDELNAADPELESAWSQPLNL
jgi:ankyrin repeat protein